MINVAKLTEELLAAGLDVLMVDSSGKVILKGATTEEQQALVDFILAKHDPIDYVTLVQNNAESEAAAVPNWASWTETEALAWHDTNVKTPIDTMTTLAQAKAAMQKLETENRAMIRLIIALRNDCFPRLQNR